MRRKQGRRPPPPSPLRAAEPVIGQICSPLIFVGPLLFITNTVSLGSINLYHNLSRRRRKNPRALAGKTQVSAPTSRLAELRQAGRLASLVPRFLTENVGCPKLPGNLHRESQCLEQSRIKPRGLRPFLGRSDAVSRYATELFFTIKTLDCCWFLPLFSRKHFTTVT